MLRLLLPLALTRPLSAPAPEPARPERVAPLPPAAPAHPFRSAAELARSALRRPARLFDGRSGPEPYVWDESPRGARAAPGPGPGWRVVWWNVEAGITDRELLHAPLGKNLVALGRAPEAPHVIGLGEYRPGAVAPEALAALGERYRSVFFPYNATHPEWGVLALVKKGVAVEPVPGPDLDWTPPGASESRAARYRLWWLGRSFRQVDNFTRRPNLLRLKDGESALDVVLYHAPQPWHPMESIKGLRGRLWSVAHLLGLRADPLVHQARRLRAWLEAEYGPAFDRRPFVLLGDFNATRHSPGESLFGDVLRRAFPRSAPTFPSASAATRGAFAPMQIDHGFAGPGVEILEASAPPLRGSDHYPIGLRAAERR